MKNKDNWGTPEYLYEKLDEEFHFTLDPCPYPRPKWDGLQINWGDEISSPKIAASQIAAKHIISGEGTSDYIKTLHKYFSSKQTVKEES